MRSAIHNAYKSAAEMVLPVRSSSGFKEKGVLTPDEFVAAGDFLVTTCPTWSWEAGDPSKKRPFLPDDKQYLVTRNIPCLCRARDLLAGKMEEELLPNEGTEDAWVSTGGDKSNEQEEVMDMSLNEEMNQMTLENQEVENQKEEEEEEEDVPDMEDFVVEEEDDTVTIIQHRKASKGDAGNDKILKTRTYDLSVTYDKYYQTPRFWLVGYDESRQLLKPELSLEDVSAEHAEKTVTIEAHPNLPLAAASIHPCRHASVMKKLIDNMSEAGKEPTVEFYLILFLKFIASIVPTIDYDYTMPADAGSSK